MEFLRGFMGDPHHEELKNKVKAIETTKNILRQIETKLELEIHDYYSLMGNMHNLGFDFLGAIIANIKTMIRPPGDLIDRLTDEFPSSDALELKFLLETMNKIRDKRLRKDCNAFIRLARQRCRDYCSTIDVKELLKRLEEECDKLFTSEFLMLSGVALSRASRFNDIMGDVWLLLGRSFGLNRVNEVRAIMRDDVKQITQ